MLHRRQTRVRAAAPGARYLADYPIRDPQSASGPEGLGSLAAMQDHPERLVVVLQEEDGASLDLM